MTKTAAAALNDTGAARFAPPPLMAAPGIADVLAATSESANEDPSLQLAETMDRSLHYLLSRVTLGVSPMAMAEAYFCLLYTSDAADE